MTPSYKSTTKIFVATHSTGTILELQQGNTFTQQRVKSYILTATTPLVLQPVVDQLALPLSAGQLAEKVEVSAEQSTVVISISAHDPTPEGATAIAAGVAESLMRVVGELEATAKDNQSPLKLTVVAPAEVPRTPASPDTQRNLVFGLVFGLGLGIAVSILRTLLNTKIRGEDELKRITDVAVLGGIPFDPDAVKKPLLTHSPSFSSPRAEAFRQVRTNLQFTYLGRTSKTLLITSAVPGEGKSSSCVNLAMTMAHAGQSVVLVDADLRKPSIAGYLGLEQAAGLTTALIGRAKLTDLLQPYGPDDLQILTSGRIPPNPSEVLGSQEMAHQVGGVVVVAGAKKVHIAELRKALGMLKMVEAPLLGIVLNMVPGRGPDSHHYGYGSYSLSEKELKAAAEADQLRSQLRHAAQPVAVPLPFRSPHGAGTQDSLVRKGHDLNSNSF
jgi:Mrp family chromosome partitioning ATPase/capsular polysaccharide biosynthesis protein